MPLESLRKLYDGVSSEYEIGDFNTFKTKMGNPNSRKKFYDFVSSGNKLDIGDYESFELKVSSKAPAVKPENVFIDPDESLGQPSYNDIIYQSVAKQENSIAPNNPYGVNLPRKKSNLERIKGMGGSLMAGSQSLLQFEDLDNGKKVGEGIIDNILKVSKNDPALFYSNYSGLDVGSPEVKSFVEVVNQNKKLLTENQENPRVETNLDRIIKSLEMNKDNPQYVLSALKNEKPVEALANNSQNVMGIPLSAIPGIEQPKRPDRKKISSKEVAKAQNYLFFKQEIAKEKKKGLSDFDAYKKIRSDLKLPSEIVENAMETSITGSLFRIFGLDQPTDVSIYQEVLQKDPNLLSASRFELLTASALSLLMPADALLFKGGGQLKKLKSVGKAGDFIANKLARVTNKPLPQVRVHVKNAIETVTGGAGGFAAFDAGRSIVDQIEETGSVDPIEVVEHAIKGAIVGSFTSGLGLAGSVAGKSTKIPLVDRATEFAGEIVGLGTVGPLVAGKQITKEGYFDAAGTVIGLKLLKTLTPSQAEFMKKSVATEAERIVESTGKPPHEVLNKVGEILKTSVQLAIEGKIPEKTIRERIAEYEVAEGAREPIEPGLKRVEDLQIIENLKKQGFSQSEAEQRQKIVLRDAGVESQEILRNPTMNNERLQLNLQVNKLSKQISELEKAGADQGLLDNLQNKIDSRVIKLNEMGVSKAEINKALTPKTTQGTKEIDLTRISEQSLSKQFPKSELVKFLKSKGVEVSSKDAKVSLIRKIKTLSREQYVLESQPRPDIIPTESGVMPKTTPSTKEVRLQMERRSRSEQERLDKTLQERDFFNRKFESDPMREVPFHPADAGRKAVAEIQAIEKAKDVQKKSIKIIKTNKKKVTGIDVDGNPADYNVKIGDRVSVNQSTTPVKIKKFKRGKDTNIIEVESNRGIEELTDRNLFTPEKVTKQKVNKQNLKPVSELEGKMKIDGFLIQRKFTDLDLTLKANENTLKQSQLTESQRIRLEASNRKTKQLKEDLRNNAELNGVELQAFMGIPSPRLIRQLFGKKEKAPRKYSDVEIDRLYNNAMQRLDKENVKEKISVKTIPNDLPPKFQGKVSRALNWVGSDMVDRVKAMGTPSSIEASEKLRQAVDLEKKTYGELTDVLDPALKISGSGKDAMNLAKFVEVTINGEKVLMNRLHLGIEGKLKLKGRELEISERIKDVIEKRGFIFERNNIMQEAPDGSIRPFKVTGRNIAPRIMTPEFYDLLNRGKYSPEFDLLINEFSKTTGQSKESIAEYFSELSDNVKGEVSLNQSTPTRTTQAEHSRKWKDIPHAIKINGDIVPIVEYRPFEYSRRLAETGSNRISVVKVFGQEIDKSSIINQLKEQIASEGGNPIVFHQAIRAISGTPVEAPVLSVGTGSRVTRAYNASMSIIRNSTLSGSIFPNIPEPLGNIRKHSGMLPLMKNIFDLTTNKKAIEAMLEKQGAITVDIANISIDPNRPVSSFVRATTEVSRRVFGIKQANEFQELLAGYTYVENVKKFKAGKGTYKDALLMEDMGFSPKNAELMRSGKAPQELYNSLIRRAPAYLTGGAQRGGEQSRLQHSKYFKGFTAFEQYSQMKIRSLSKSVQTYGKGVKEAQREGDYKKFVDVNALMASEILGTAISGSAAQLMLAFVYGGKDNLDIKIKEIEENPFRFAIESYAYSAVGGVIGSIMQSTANGKLSENPWDVFFPINVVTEIADAASGKGKYTYLEAEERFLEVAKRYFPINKGLRTMSTALGFGNDQTLKDDNAIKAYYRWKFENKYGGGYRTGEIDDEIKNFRVNMKKAYSSLRNSEDVNAIDAHIIKALDLTGKDVSSARSSILGKRLLTKSKIAPGKDNEVFENRKEVLRKRIGETAYKRLVRHDERLKTYAEFWED